jgi:hypothetical protein
MKNVIPLGLLLVALILTSCGDRTANLRNGATMSLEALTPAVSSFPPTSTSINFVSNSYRGKLSERR